MIIHRIETSKVARPGFEAYLYNSDGQEWPFSSVFVDCFGEHARVSVPRSVRLYYVISGHIQFEIDGVLSECIEGDLAIIPKGKAYAYRGEGTMFEVNIPPTGPADEVPAA